MEFLGLIWAVKKLYVYNILHTHIYKTYNICELFSVITLQLMKNFKGLNFKDY